jgi:hypothetical protein
MISLAGPLGTLALAITIYIVYNLSQMGKRKPHMPPGPATIPILGNALQIPTTGLYKQYLSHIC